jgi:hypothetical protein
MERIAVLEFSGRADPSLLAQLADEVRSVAAAELRGRYVVMTREAMAVLLKEMGGSCAEGDCEVETARNVGAALVATGEVRAIGEALVLGLRLHETGNGALLAAETVRAEDPLVLLDRCRDAARTVLRGGLGAPVIAAQGPTTRRPAGGSAGAFEEAPQQAFDAGADEVVVSLESDPAGAVVQVDGQLLCKETPCKKRLAAGEHEAVFQKERYAPAAQRFTATKGAAVKASLAPRFGWISVETVPAGVRLAIDGAEVGASPVAWREADEGTVEVAIADPCWLRSGERVPVKAGERRAVKLQAKPRLAGLKVNAEDEKGNALETTVSVDGVPAGGAGATLKVPVCAKKLSVPLGSETFEADLDLDERKVALVIARAGVRGDLTPRMAKLPGGTFEMGSRGDRVTVAPFLMDPTEVTVAAYGACVKAGKCPEPMRTESFCNWGRWFRGDHPVNCVSWNQATAYCAWAGKRLPTEEEWEWAARGAERGTTYPWGNDDPGPQLCWRRYDEGRTDGTCAVRSFPSGDSPHGLSDLAGNVSEWTSGAYDVSTTRVSRGGSWALNRASDVAAMDRTKHPDVEAQGSAVGFRCAKTQ